MWPLWTNVTELCLTDLHYWKF